MFQSALHKTKDLHNTNGQFNSGEGLKALLKSAVNTTFI